MGTNIELMGKNVIIIQMEACNITYKNIDIPDQQKRTSLKI